MSTQKTMEQKPCRRVYTFAKFEEAEKQVVPTEDWSALITLSSGISIDYEP